jgi:phosphoglycolate phosphatase
VTDTLLLFDIDGTLLDTGGAGGAALIDAAVEVLGADRDTLPPLDLAGATDGAVIRKLFSDTGCAFEPARVQAFQECYLGHLERRLKHAAFDGRLLSGVEELLLRVQDMDHFTIGLLTGNLRRGALLKLQRFDLHHHFADGGFGDDGEHRNELGPVAVKRMEHITKKTFTPPNIIVIGDTPKDIGCAHAMGAKCLAVSTGKFGSAELQPFQPWLVFDDLSDTVKVLEAFMRF